MEKIKLRLALPQDAGRLLAVYAPYVLDSTITWEYTVPTRMEMEKRIEAHLADGFPWLVAEGESGILGYAYAGRMGQRRGFDWDAEISIYLSVDECGKGIGKALYAALLALLAKQGYCNCYALVTHPNPSSESFHKAMGFTQVGLLPKAGYKKGQWVDLCYYTMLICDLPQYPRRPLPLEGLDPNMVQQILNCAAKMVHERA